MNLTHALKPPEKYFWDLAHVYDEANVTLAEHDLWDDPTRHLMLPSATGAKARDGR